jgi:hypothetical protein
VRESDRNIHKHIEHLCAYKRRAKERERKVYRYIYITYKDTLIEIGKTECKTRNKRLAVSGLDKARVSPETHFSRANCQASH